MQKFLESRGYPRWIAVTKVIDGGETALFKQYFEAPWNNVSSTTASSSSNAGCVASINIPMNYLLFDFKFFKKNSVIIRLYTLKFTIYAGV
jgi:hypothetical protein